VNECDEEETVQASNKKGSNFLMTKKKKEEEHGEDSYDEDDDNMISSFEDEFNLLQHDMTCSIQEELAIPKGWMLLDSQSTVDVF
jgi:hypothetical protein